MAVYLDNLVLLLMAPTFVVLDVQREFSPTPPHPHPHLPFGLLCVRVCSFLPIVVAPAIVAIIPPTVGSFLLAAATTAAGFSAD